MARAANCCRCPERPYKDGGRISDPTTLCATIICAPNFWACVMARAASSCPEIPVGKPK